MSLSRLAINKPRGRARIRLYRKASSSQLTLNYDPGKKSPNIPSSSDAISRLFLPNYARIYKYKRHAVARSRARARKVAPAADRKSVSPLKLHHSRSRARGREITGCPSHAAGLICCAQRERRHASCGPIHNLPLMTRAPGPFASNLCVFKERARAQPAAFNFRAIFAYRRHTVILSRAVTRTRVYDAAIREKLQRPSDRKVRGGCRADSRISQFAFLMRARGCIRTRTHL